MGEYVVYRDEGDRWIATDAVGASPIGGWAPPRSSGEAIDLLKRHLTAKGETVISIHPSGGVFHVTTGQERGPREAYMLTLEMTPETGESLKELASDTSQDINGVIRSALGMYKLAVAAHKEGKGVGIVDSPDQLRMRFF